MADDVQKAKAALEAAKLTTDARREAMKVPGFIIAVLVLVGFVVWVQCYFEADSIVDRIFIGSFTVFAVGLAELFAIFVGMAILGLIDLPKVFQDKAVNDKGGGNSVSLSRLQVFMWTLVVMTAYFHAAVKHDGAGLPAIPPELLVLMGISGGVYLASKQMTGGSPATEQPGQSKLPKAPDPDESP